MKNKYANFYRNIYRASSYQSRPSISLHIIIIIITWKHVLWPQFSEDLFLRCNKFSVSSQTARLEILGGTCRRMVTVFVAVLTENRLFENETPGFTFAIRYMSTQFINSDRWSVAQLRPVAGVPPRRPEFKPRSSHVGSVVGRAALGQVLSENFGFPCQSFIPLIAP
jgi:hypothetical protein